jgi:lysophospholipase L1-like esterase
VSASNATSIPRFLALGDSYTIGEGVEADERWPAQLARRLRAQGIAIGDPQVIARTGWTTDELAAAIGTAAPRPPHALVTLLIGVNNQYRGRALDEYAIQFDALLALAIAQGGGHAGRVVVVSIPDWGVTGFARTEGRDAQAIGREIDAFNAAARGSALAAGAAFVDITGLSRDAGDAASMLVADRLHPSAAQYALWAEEIVPLARRVLRESTEGSQPHGA